MRIIVKDAKEFERLLEALGQDLTLAAVHFRLFKDLRSAARDYEIEFREANTFWWLTLNAHLQNALHALSRAYDQHRGTLSLGSWLRTIRANLHLFAVDHFRERLRENPFVESLAEQARAPDLAQLERDIRYCSPNNEFVRRLVTVRGNALAHRNAGLAAKGQTIFESVDLSHDALDELIVRGYEIYNHYNQLFRAASLSPQMLGHDDFKQVLTALRRSAKLREFQNELELERER